MCTINNSSEKFKNTYDFLSFINKNSYRDNFLLSNQVLSKNPLTNNFLNRFLNNATIKQHSLYSIFQKLSKYYFKSFKELILYIFRFIEYALFSSHFSPANNHKELILIDTFFLTDKINQSGRFIELYFPGLETQLKKINKCYAYLPVFFGTNRLFNLSRIFKILKREKVPILSEYQLLSIIDLLRLFYFIVFYPPHVFKFLQTLKQNLYEVGLLKYELIDTLDQVTFLHFSRYLQGRRIAKLPFENIKVISWYENQVIHKNLYRGLKMIPHKVKIYGAQLFLFSKNILNIIPDENEEPFGIIPDKIIVNGSWFIPKRTKFSYIVGPSLRYSKIFNSVDNKKIRNNILVVLPYLASDAENILKVIIEAKICCNDILIKSHPSIKIDKFKQFLPANFRIVNDDIYKLFETTKIMISAGSGTLIEAASLGIPVVVIKNNKIPNFNPLPDDGKGIIWEAISDAEDLRCQIYKFEEMLSNNFEEISQVADRYKKLFFCENSEENIIKAFDLKD